MSGIKGPSRRGFTLRELAALLSIVGVIAAVVVPKLLHVKCSPASSVAEYHISQLNALVEQHYIDTSEWPADLHQLIDRNYLVSVPTHPEPGKSYELNCETHLVEQVINSTPAPEHQATVLPGLPAGGTTEGGPWSSTAE